MRMILPQILIRGIALRKRPWWAAHPEAEMARLRYAWLPFALILAGLIQACGAAAELLAAANIRQLTITRLGSIFPNLTALPKNFT